ncbi:hypothetical protein IFR05_010298 [Cadophora sp. M221]|nr:hypothetical protein IFR05_010298 [Cadophora sp. M221]
MLFKTITPSIIAALGLIEIVAEAHFQLAIPTSLGFDDDLEGVAPCGNFEPSIRTNATDFPISGGNVGLFTSHSTSNLEFKAALTTNLTQWVSLTPVLSQSGLGYFCEPQIPGPKAWEGKSAVLQVIQTAHHGALYQCAAIKFVKAVVGPTQIDPRCKNATGSAAVWLS